MRLAPVASSSSTWWKPSTLPETWAFPTTTAPTSARSSRLPSSWASQNAGTGDYTGPVTASVSPLPSTANPMTYQLDDGAIQALTSSTPITISGDGTHNLVVTDSAGLQATSEFVIDTGGPVISTSTSAMPSNGWVAPGTTLTVNVTDPSGAAVTSVTYSASGANPITSQTRSGASLPFVISGFTANGATSVMISATDANDVTVTETVPVDVDNQAPNLSCTEPSPNTEGWFTSEVEVTCAATDNESGIAPNTNVYSNYSTSSATVELWTTVSPGSSSTNALASVGGSTTVTACNAFGQCASDGPFSFQVDLTTPTVVVSSPSQDLQYNLGEKVAATFSCSDSGSGVSGCTANVISTANANSIAVQWLERAHLQLRGVHLHGHRGEQGRCDRDRSELRLRSLSLMILVRSACRGPSPSPTRSWSRDRVPTRRAR